MAGVAVASNVYVTVYIGFMAVLQALAPIAGHHFGAHRWRQIGDDVQQALWLAGALAVAAVPCLLATGFWTDFAGVDGKVAAITETYLHAVAFGRAGRPGDTRLRRAQRARSRARRSRWSST